MTAVGDERGRMFDAVADLYDEVRPDYPPALYDLLESAVGGLAGRAVLDLAAGPGLASRQLRGRGARVVAVEPGTNLAARLRAGAPDVQVVRALGEALPFRAAAFDLVTCATAWHWLHAGQTVEAVRRVLRPGGHLALWWANHRWGEGVDWEDAQSAVLDRWEVERGSRALKPTGVGPREAAADLRARGLEVLVDVELRWQRDVTLARHLDVLRTHSDNLALGAAKEELIAEIAAALQPWPVVTERLHGPLVVARLPLTALA